MAAVRRRFSGGFAVQTLQDCRPTGRPFRRKLASTNVPTNRLRQAWSVIAVANGYRSIRRDSPKVCQWSFFKAYPIRECRTLLLIQFRFSNSGGLEEVPIRKHRTYSEETEMCTAAKVQLADRTNPAAYSGSKK